MADQFNILAIPGSLRKGSFNLALLKKAREIAPPALKVSIADLKEIPLYNDDLIPDDIPPGVHKLRQRITDADALLISTPEYNYSMPGVMKNALDWFSTYPLGNLLDDKLVAIMGASKTGFGTVRTQLHLRQVLHAVNAQVIRRPEVYVSRAGSLINKQGQLVDEKTITRISALLDSLKSKLENR